MELVVIVSIVVICVVALLGAAGFWIEAGADRHESV